MCPANISSHGLAVVLGMLLTPALGNIIWLIAEGFIDKGGCFLT
jgi:hypothetical protein